MKATKLYRTASGLLFLWASGNTYGLLMFWHVAGSMSPVRFPVGHSGFSYAQVVLGYEVFCSFCVLLQRTWLGTWARWLEQCLKPLEAWGGFSSRTHWSESI